MASRALRVGFPSLFALIAACSGDRAEEPLGVFREALSTTGRILSFEGGIGGAGTGLDWKAAVGTAVSTTPASHLSKAMALGANWNPSASSAPLPALGPLSGPPKIDVRFPTGYANQGSYWGQAALFITCSSANIFNHYVPPAQLQGPTGTYKTYTLGALPPNVATALSNQSGCTVKVELNLSNSGTKPVLVDRLTFGEAPEGSGGAGGSGGSGGKGGTGGAGGSTGGTGGSTGGTGGSGGSSGGTGGSTGGAGGSTGGTGGTGGSGGSPGPADVEYFIELPVNVARDAVALGAYGAGLSLQDNVEVRTTSTGYSSVSSVHTSTVAELGVSADVQHLWSQPNVSLRNNALVHGNLLTEGTVSLQSGAAILGARVENTELDPIQHLGWTIHFPLLNGGSLDLEPGQVRTISAGAFAGGNIKTGARLTLSTPGIYTLNGSLTLEPGSTLDIDNTAGSVEIYLRNDFTFRGTLAPRDPTQANILVGVAGTTPVPIDAPWRGILVAPHAVVTLATASAGHFGAVYAKGIHASPNTIFTHTPLDPPNFCTANSECNGLCTCEPGGECDDDGDCATGIDCAPSGDCGGIDGSCTTTSHCAPGLTCVGGVCRPCEEDPSDPACSPSHCSNGVRDQGETDVDCGGPCPGCDPGGGCGSTGDCADGLECGTNNGACFGAGKPRGDRVCWPAFCGDGDPSQCGQSDSPCGSNCACVNPCNADDAESTCPEAEECVRGIGYGFGSTQRDACLDDSCPSDDCGTWSSLCGPPCRCTPDCTSATCANPDDGCDNGVDCAEVCDRDDPCTDSVQCESGTECLEGVCRPSDCAFALVRPPLCGTPDAECGEECPICTPACDGKQCGFDARCGESCGTCPDGSSCDATGQCVTATSDPPADVPDGDGGEEPIDELPPVPAAGVGAVAGAFSVSDQGRPVYTVPIDVPPGRAGMEPSLSLRYTGAKESGIVGMGWTVDGLSSITRCAKIQALHGQATPIKNDTSDLFCLDGKRLTGVEGVYGTEGAKYRTEIDGFSKVVSHVEGDGFQFENPVLLPREEQGPDYFQVFSKDGRILTFGRTRDSLVITRNGLRLAWHLNRIEDRAGNTVNFSYRAAGGTFLHLDEAFPVTITPDVISYTGHGDSPGSRSVRFEYEPRSDATLLARQGGMMIRHLGRLARIATSLNGEPVKNFKLTYRDQTLSQLEKVFECEGADDARCKRPTTFEYAAVQGFSEANRGPQIDFQSVSQLDANGDGLPDYFSSTVEIEGAPAAPDMTAWFLAGDLAVSASYYAGPEVGIPAQLVWEITKFFILEELAPSPAISINNELIFGSPSRTEPLLRADSSRPCSATTTPPYFPIYFVDYNRDGRDDMAGICNDSSFRVSISQGDGRFLPLPPVMTLPLVEANDRFRLSRPPPILIDVDGDALEDLISCKNDDSLEFRRRAGPTETDGFEDPIDVPEPIHDYCEHVNPNYVIIDVDGDGTHDVFSVGQVLRYSATDEEPFTWVGVGAALGGTILDLNGDGLQDSMTTTATDSTVTARINTGRGSFIVRNLGRPVPQLPPGSNARRRIALLDYDRDGRTDILENWRLTQNGVNDAKTFALLPNSDATGFLAEPVPGLIDEREPTGCRWSSSGDLDGDGNVDLYGCQAVFYGSGVNNRALSRVEDGLGNVTTVTYDEAGTYTSDCPDSNWPEACVPRMTGLVSSHQEGFVDNSPFDPTRIERTTKYAYHNARVNVTGHGWLGFERRTIAEDTAGRTTTITFEPPARYSDAGAPKTDTAPPYLYPLAGLAKTVVIDESVAEVVGTPQPLESGVFDRRSRVENKWIVGVSTANLPFPELEERSTVLYDRPVNDPPLDFEENGALLTEHISLFDTDAYGNVTHHSERFVPDGESAYERRNTIHVFSPDPESWLISNPELIFTESGRNSQTQRQTWDPAYDGRGLLESMTRGSAASGVPSEHHKTTYIRDEFGNPLQIVETVLTGEAPRTTIITYDADNVYPQTVTNTLGHVTQVRFDGRWGVPSTVVDPNGVASQRVYDGLGVLAEIHDSAGTTIHTYETLEPFPITGPPSFQTRITTDRQGVNGTRDGREVVHLDNYGRPVANISEGFGGVDVLSRRGYDALGRVTSMVAPHTADVVPEPITRMSYDGLDRITRVTRPDSSFAERQYASRETLKIEHLGWLQGVDCTSSNLKCVVGVELSVDEEGKRDVILTDHRGLALRNVDGENVATPTRSSNYVYGPFNRLVTARDNAANTTSSAFDAYGRLLSSSNPDVAARTYTYNGYDDLATSSDPNGQTRTYSYDDLGRPTTIIDGTSTTRWFYDQGANALGKLSEMVSPGTTEYPDGQRLAYTYEPVVSGNRGMLKRLDYIIDGVTYPVTFAYDDLARTSRIDYPNLGGGTPIAASHQYDTSGILTGVDEVGSGTPRPLWRMTEVFRGYLLQRETFGNDAATTYVYNGDRELLTGIQTTIDSDIVQDLGYTHYKNELVFERTSPVAQKRHEYDALNRLSAVVETSGGTTETLTYGHDILGNLTQQGSTTTTYRADRPHLVDAVGSSNGYQHDANGNVTRRAGPSIPGGVQDIAYTPFDLPKRITTAEGTAQEKVALFEYTPDEERLIRRDPDVTRHFVTDLYQRVIDTGTTTTREERFRLYAGDRMLGEIVRKNGTDETLYFHQDNLGSVELISNDTGETTTQGFGAFGALTTSSMITRAGFTGHQHEADLELIDMRGRMYDPLAGRFLSTDPIMQAPFSSQGLNPYSYVFNDPINLTDPSGYAAFGWNDLGTAISGVWPVAPMMISAGGGLAFGPIGLGAVRAAAGGYHPGGAISASSTGLGKLGVQPGPSFQEWWGGPDLRLAQKPPDHVTVEVRLSPDMSPTGPPKARTGGRLAWREFPRGSEKTSEIPTPRRADARSASPPKTKLDAMKSDLTKVAKQEGKRFLRDLGKELNKVDWNVLLAAALIGSGAVAKGVDFEWRQQNSATYSNGR